VARCSCPAPGRPARGVPFHEPGLADTLARAASLIEFTTDPAQLYGEADVVFVCVDTPPRRDGAGDLSRVAAVIDAIPTWAHPLIVMNSTVPIGTGGQIIELLRQRGRGDIGYTSNPEFLREGSAMLDVSNPDRIVIGGHTDHDIERVAALHQPTTTPIIRTDTTSAELIKYASNAFLATKISFINEIANLCEAVGATVATVANGMGLDRRIAPTFLNAGIGYGGSCFAKDITALQSVATAHGVPLRIIAATQEVNALQPTVVLDKLERHLHQIAGARVALLGLTFKPHTSDTRSATSIELARLLVTAGVDVVTHDPIASPNAHEFQGCEFAATIRDALNGADAAVIVTEWPQFRALLAPSLARSMRYPLLIDGRNHIDPLEATSAGYRYEGVGRPSTHVTQTMAMATDRPVRLRSAA
jgi:UDPglucose 6-dehydrogenase